MGEPLENLYFNWLCAKVVDPSLTDPSKTYWSLFRILHTTEFVWLISGDDNRAEDGKDLRKEFILLADIPDDPAWRTGEGCSMLEMLIAFSKRAFDLTDIPALNWFWEFLDNLYLIESTDRYIDENDVAEKLDTFIWRKYDINGDGGSLFPLEHIVEDQKSIQLWYQFCNYLIDQDRLIY